MDTDVRPRRCQYLFIEIGDEFYLYHLYLCSCSHFQTFHQYLAVVIQIIVACRPILSEILHNDLNWAFSSDLAMLIMRMYALYERSQKVLALYIVVAVAIVVVGCVSFNFNRNSRLASYSNADIVVYSGRCWVEKKKKIWTCSRASVAVWVWVEKGTYNSSWHRV